MQYGVTSRVTDQHGALRRGFGHAKAAKSLGPETALVHLWYLECMFWLIYLLSAILCIWGGCLLARVIANRLELGLFRRKQRKEAMEAAGTMAGGANAPTTSGLPEVKRRSGWWTLVGLSVMLFGGGVAFIIDAVDAMIDHGRDWRSSDFTDHFMTTTLIMSLGLSGGLAVVGFRFDPPLGRRRCPKCWYDMNATKGRLCPECGHEVSSERQLYKSRRSRMTIAMAAVPLLVYPIATRVLYAVRVGPIGLIPTTVMVLAWEWLPDKVVGTNRGVGAWGPFQPGTLASRIEVKELWDWQDALLDWRCQQTMRTATNVKSMYRASQLPSQGVTLDEAFMQSLRPRLGGLIAGVDWTDIESRVAVEWLVQIVLSHIEDAEVQRELVKQIVAIAPTLLNRMATPPMGWDSAELTLLGVPGVADALGQPFFDAFEARLAAPNMQIFSRYQCARVLRLTTPDEFASVALRAIESADDKTRVQVIQACIWHSDEPSINEKAIEMLKSIDAASSEEVVAAFLWCQPIEVRNEALKRFAADHYDKVSCIMALQQAIPQGTWNGNQIALVAVGIRKSLAHSDATVVNAALTLINQMSLLTDLTRASLEELAKNPGTKNGAFAKTILDRLPPKVPVPEEAQP